MRAVRGTVTRAEHSVGPLTGLLVLDFGQTAVGPVSAMFLGYLGATVIKVEQPRGELGRYDISRKCDAGLTFLSTNLGKYGVVLDFKDAEDYAYALALIARADVVIDNFRAPDVMRRLGLDYFDVLRPTNPSLVYLQSSSFQGRGPWSALPSFEWAAQAVSGFAGATGCSDGPPEFSRGTAYLDWSGAMVNTVAVLAGLHRRVATGEGSMLSTSQFGTSVFVGSSKLATYSVGPGAATRPGQAVGHEILDRAFATADSYLAICAPTEPIWRRLLGAVGLPIGTPHDPSGVELEPVIKSANTEEWLVRLREARVPTGSIRPASTLVEALRSEPQVGAEALLREHDAPRRGVLYAAPPWEIVGAKEVEPRPSPELGEHDELVKSLLEPAAALPAVTAATTSGAWGMSPLSQTKPLVGAKIVEVGTGLAVGTAGQILAELGGAVTKVLPPWGDSAVAEHLHREKISERLDLAKSEDRGRFYDLVGQAAAVMVSGPMRFRHAFGLDETDLRRVREDVVYCGLTGYGTAGPLADAPATEFDVQVMSGMTRTLGRRDDLPVRQGFHLVSVNTGLAAAQAVLAGLLAPDGGAALGRHFEVSLLRTAVALSGWNITAESGHDGIQGRQVQAATWPPDHGYTCKDRQVLISIRNNDEGWVRFLAALDRVDLLVDERFNTLDGLRANEWRLPDLLAKTTGRLTSDELRQIVVASGGDLVPVLDPREVLVHAQTLAQHLVRPGTGAVGLPVDLVSR